MKAARTLRSQSGFSLIELMVVVAIIGILATIAIPNFQRFSAKARQTEGKGYLSTIYSGEKAFIAEWNVYSTCMEKIGFTIDGTNAFYTAGFLTTFPGTAGACAADRRGAGTLQASTAAGAGATATFNASATGTPNGMAREDRWEIDHLRVVSNTQSGI